MIDQGKQPNPGAPAQQNPSTESLKKQGRDTAHEVGEAAQHQAEGYFNQQRDNAAEQSHKLTGVLQKMADEFDNQQQPFFSKQARKFADTTERFSHNLRDKDLRSVCDEAQSFSRREPALFVGGVIAAGFLVSRFLRSSAQHSSAQHSSAQNSTAQHSSAQHSSNQQPPGVGNHTSPLTSSAAGSMDSRSTPGSESL